MHGLELQDNWLRGRIPDVLGKLTQLTTLALHGNTLEGLVPHQAICAMTQLGTLTLGGDVGGNDDLSVTAEGAAAIRVALSPDADIFLPKISEGEMGESAALEQANAVAKERAMAQEKEETEEAARRAAAQEAATKRREAAKAVEAYSKNEKQKAVAKVKEAEYKAKEQVKAQEAAKAEAAADKERVAAMADEVLRVASAARKEANPHPPPPKPKPAPQPDTSVADSFWVKPRASRVSSAPPKPPSPRQAPPPAEEPPAEKKKKRFSLVPSRFSRSSPATGGGTGVGLGSTAPNVPSARRQSREIAGAMPTLSEDGPSTVTAYHSPRANLSKSAPADQSYVQDQFSHRPPAASPGKVAMGDWNERVSEGHVRL
jgi:hypothetical protein